MGCIVHMIQLISYPEYIVNHCGEYCNFHFAMEINKLLNSEHSWFIQITTPLPLIYVTSVSFLPFFASLCLSSIHFCYGNR